MSMTLSRFLHICEHRIQALFRREKLDDQLEQELSFHLEQLVQENIQAGMRADLARVEARRTLGNFVVIKEECRDQRRVTWIHDFRQDLRYALQMMRKHAVLTAIAAMALAVCIGANTVVLSSWLTLAVGDLPVPDADRVVTIGTFRDLDRPGGNASIPEYVAWKERTRSFESMGTSITVHQDLGADQPGAHPERLVGQAVTQSLFQTLRVQPVLGRLFSEDEARFGKAPARVVVLSERLWQRRFKGDRNILGREIHLDGRSMTVIGVMPASFWYPNKDSEYWVPLGVTRFQLENSARLFLVTARLANGTTLEQAQADVGNVAAQLAHDFPERYKGFSMRAIPLREHWFGWFRKPLLMLEVAVALGLLIACANVSTLLLKRVPVRRPEISRRLLMGAGRGRIVRQFLAESLLLSVIGGALALLIAAWGVTSFDYVSPPPGRLPITVIGEMKGIPQFTVLLSAISCLLLGFLPALAAVSSGNSPRQTEGRRSPAGILVAVQVSLALVLLVPSGLLINSFIRLALDDRGFDPRGVLTFQYRIPRCGLCGTFRLISRDARHGCETSDARDATCLRELENTSWRRFGCGFFGSSRERHPLADGNPACRRTRNSRKPSGARGGKHHLSPRHGKLLLHPEDASRQWPELRRSRYFIGSMGCCHQRDPRSTVLAGRESHRKAFHRRRRRLASACVKWLALCATFRCNMSVPAHPGLWPTRCTVNNPRDISAEMPACSAR